MPINPALIFAILSGALSLATEAKDLIDRWSKGGSISQEEFDALVTKSSDLHAEMERRRADIT